MFWESKAASIRRSDRRGFLKMRFMERGQLDIVIGPVADVGDFLGAGSDPEIFGDPVPTLSAP